MKVKDLAEKLNLKIVSGSEGLNNEISGGYTSDLLSDVIGHAEQGNAWITLQTHKNVVAVASLKDLACVILVKDLTPDEDTILQSNEENIPILSAADSTFTTTGKVFSILN